MKQLTFLLLFLFTGLLAFAQKPYSHYLDYSSEWYLYQKGNDGFRETKTYRTEFIDGDTIIGGQSYFKRYIIRLDSIFPHNPPSSPYSQVSGPRYLYAMREDSSRQIFRRDGLAFPDQPLYEHGLQVGDSIFNTLNCLITLIDSVYLGSTSLKRWHPTPGIWNGKIVEGVGFTGPVCGGSFHATWNLVCYQKAGLWLNLDSTISCNTFEKPIRRFVTSLDSRTPESVKIFPNPASERIFIQFNTKALRIATVYNGLGKRLFSQTFAQTVNELPINTLQKGIYVIQIRDNYRIQSYKFVVN